MMSERNLEDAYEISEDNRGRFHTKIAVPSKYYGAVIGFKGRNIQSIESDTGTLITIPSRGHEENIRVSGCSRSSVALARMRIEQIVKEHKTSRRFTHFLSIPVNDAVIVEKFVEFKDKVLTLNIDEVVESIFQKPRKLHLTFGILLLEDKEKIALAEKELQECEHIIRTAKAKFNESGNLSITISGVQSMNDDPNNCRILYGKVNSEILQTIADNMVDHFVAKGLMKKQGDHVKLHVTFMNFTFLRRNKGNFDASSIMRHYSEHEFGVQKLHEVHLSNVAEIDEDSGFYKADGIMHMP